MSHQLSINSKGALCLSGRIGLNNVVAVSARGKELIKTMADINVDLSGVQQGDSSSLAMLVDWLRFAKSQNKKIVLTNMPQSMLDLSRVCGLDSVLPIVGEYIIKNGS